MGPQKNYFTDLRSNLSEMESKPFQSSDSEYILKQKAYINVKYHSIEEELLKKKQYWGGRKNV